VIAFTIAWLLSVSSLVGFATLFPEGLDGGSRLGLCLVPWMVLAGWPRTRDLPWTHSFTALALCLAPLAMGARLDISTERADALIVGGFGALIVVLLSAAALLARASVARTRNYGIAWVVTVLVLPLLVGSSEWLHVETPAALSWLASASPVWMAWAEVTGGDVVPWGPLVACMGLVGIASCGETDEAQEEHS